MTIGIFPPLINRALIAWMVSDEVWDPCTISTRGTMWGGANQWVIRTLSGRRVSTNLKMSK